MGNLLERLFVFLLRLTVRTLLRILLWLWRHIVVEWFTFPGD